MATISLSNDFIGVRPHTVVSATGTLGALNDAFGEGVNFDPIQSVSVHVTAVGVGTLTFEVSNDKVNWIAKSLSSPAGVSSSTASAVGMWSGEIGARYFRVRLSAWTSGTFAVALYGSSESQSANSVTISGTVALGSPGTGTTALGKAEDAVHTTGDTGVFMLGVRAPASPATQTSAVGDYGSIAIDAEGKQIPAGQADPGMTWDSNVALTTTTDVALRAAGGAGVRNFVKTLILENTGGAAARVLVRDGTTNKVTATVAAGQTLVVYLDPPLRGTAATALNAQLGAAGTVTVTTLGFIGV